MAVLARSPHRSRKYTIPRGVALSDHTWPSGWWRAWKSAEHDSTAKSTFEQNSHPDKRGGCRMADTVLDATARLSWGVKAVWGGWEPDSLSNRANLNFQVLRERMFPFSEKCGEKRKIEVLLRHGLGVESWRVPGSLRVWCVMLRTSGISSVIGGEPEQLRTTPCPAPANHQRISELALFFFKFRGRCVDQSANQRIACHKTFSRHKTYSLFTD